MHCYRYMYFQYSMFYLALLLNPKFRISTSQSARMFGWIDSMYHFKALSLATGLLLISFGLGHLFEKNPSGQSTSSISYFWNRLQESDWYWLSWQLKLLSSIVHISHICHSTESYANLQKYKKDFVLLPDCTCLPISSWTNIISSNCCVDFFTRQDKFIIHFMCTIIRDNTFVVNCF